MSDPSVRGIVERSLFSSYSFTQLSLATFSAREFLFDGLDEFVDMIALPWAPSVNEDQIRRGLRVMEEPAVSDRMVATFAQVSIEPPMVSLKPPASNAPRPKILVNLLQTGLSRQRFSPSAVAGEAQLHQLETLVAEDRVLRGRFSETGLTPTAAAVLMLIFSIEAWEYRAAAQTVNSVLDYEVPYSLSPEIQSASLRAVIAEARRFAVLPLYAGTLGAATSVSTGQYVTALEMAAAGGGATIIIAGSAAVADRLLQVLARRDIRPKGD